MEDKDEYYEIDIESFKDKQLFKAVILMTIFGVLGGILLFQDEFIFKLLGILCIILDVFIEVYFLKKLDVKKELKEAKEQLYNLIKKAETAKKDLEKLDEKIFGFLGSGFNVATFTEKLEKTVGCVGFGSTSIMDKINSLTNKTNKHDEEIEKLKSRKF